MSRIPNHNLDKHTDNNQPIKKFPIPITEFLYWYIVYHPPPSIYEKKSSNQSRGGIF